MEYFPNLLDWGRNPFYTEQLEGLEFHRTHFTNCPAANGFPLPTRSSDKTLAMLIPGDEIQTSQSDIKKPSIICSQPRYHSNISLKCWVRVSVQPLTSHKVLSKMLINGDYSITYKMRIIPSTPQTSMKVMKNKDIVSFKFF